MYFFFKYFIMKRFLMMIIIEIEKNIGKISKKKKKMLFFLNKYLVGYG